MANCESCNTTIPNDSHFCPHCGERYKNNPPLPHNFCRDCQLLVPFSSNFCPRCGRSIYKTKPYDSINRLLEFFKKLKKTHIKYIIDGVIICILIIFISQRALLIDQNIIPDNVIFTSGLFIYVYIYFYLRICKKIFFGEMLHSQAFLIENFYSNSPLDEIQDKINKIFNNLFYHFKYTFKNNKSIEVKKILVVSDSILSIKKPRKHILIEKKMETGKIKIYINLSNYDSNLYISWVTYYLGELSLFRILFFGPMMGPLFIASIINPIQLIPEWVSNDNTTLNKKLKPTKSLDNLLLLFRHTRDEFDDDDILSFELTISNIIDKYQKDLLVNINK